MVNFPYSDELEQMLSQLHGGKKSSFDIFIVPYLSNEKM
jgi:hypothetical protein